MSDIVERLRYLSFGVESKDVLEAAAEIERLNEVIRLTYKMNCGRGYEHLELPEAIAAVRKKDLDEIERLRGLLRWWLSAGGADEESIRATLCWETRHE